MADIVNGKLCTIEFLGTRHNSMLHVMSMTLDMQLLPGTKIEYFENLRVLRPGPSLHYVDDRLFPALS